MSRQYELQEQIGELLMELAALDAQTAMSIATGIFVSVLVSYMNAMGVDSDKEIFIEGGPNRDITVHPTKGTLQ